MRLLSAVALLLLALPAQAGVKAGPNVMPGGHHRLRTPAATAVLPDFSAAVGAWSLRKLRPEYAGQSIRLRRASDNAQQDIGFVGTAFDTTSAATFCNATTCFVAKWYDQSGAVRDFVQAVAGNQPAFAFSCTADGTPCIRLTAGTMTLAASTVTPAGAAVSFSSVNRRTAGAGACALVTENSNNNRFMFNTSAGTYFMAATGNMTAVQGEGSWHAAQGVINGAGSYILVDSTVTTGTVTKVLAAAAPNITGAAVTTCDTVEAVVWDNLALTQVQAQALADDQRNYWAPLPLDGFTQPAAAYSLRKLKSTYAGPAIRLRRASDNAETDIGFLGFVPGLGSPLDVAAVNAHCAATSCTVATWYDQSGNARHAVQATAGNQPAYLAACLNGLPCVRVTTATQTLGTVATITPAVPLTMSAVGQRTVSGANVCQAMHIHFNQFYIQAGAAQWVAQGTGSVTANTTDGVPHAGVAILDGAASVVRVDGTETTGTVTATTGADVLQVAMNSPSPTVCDWTEGIFWNGYALAAGERAALTTNQRGFWGF